jgi:hypothetical protein
MEAVGTTNTQPVLTVSVLADEEEPIVRPVLLIDGSANGACLAGIVCIDLDDEGRVR